MIYGILFTFVNKRWFFRWNSIFFHLLIVCNIYMIQKKMVLKFKYAINKTFMLILISS